MEKEVVCYIYGFKADILGRRNSFLFEKQDDAQIARFMVYKMFDNQRLTVKGFVPPVTKVRKHVLRENELPDYRILSNYDDFINYWSELSNNMITKDLSI